MYLHTAAYSESLGSVTDSDTDAANDDVMQRRNSHLIFSEPFNLLGVYGSSTTLTRARFGAPKMTVRGASHIFPLGRTDTVPSRPVIHDLTDEPMELPMNEEVTILSTTDAVGPVIANYLLWLAKPEWTRNFPPYVERFKTRATVVIAAGAASSWTALAPVVMERDLYNGVYAIVGAQVVAANAIGFRMFFPSQQVVGGRQLRPGGLVTNALGDFPLPGQLGEWGEWGRFHTFELPSIQTFEDTAGGTYEVRLDVLYLGESIELLRKSM